MEPANVDEHCSLVGDVQDKAGLVTGPDSLLRQTTGSGKVKTLLVLQHICQGSRNTSLIHQRSTIEQVPRYD